MSENRDILEQLIKEDLEKEAAVIRETIAAEEDPEMLSAEKKAEIKEKLYEKIHEYEVARLVEQLPEKYQEAMKVGLETMNDADAGQPHMDTGQRGNVAGKLDAAGSGAEDAGSSDHDGKKPETGTGKADVVCRSDRGTGMREESTVPEDIVCRSDRGTGRREEGTVPEDVVCRSDNGAGTPHGDGSCPGAVRQADTEDSRLSHSAVSEDAGVRCADDLPGQNEEGMEEDGKDIGRSVKKNVRRRRRYRAYAGAAAVVALVAILGVNTFGGPENIMRMMKRGVGVRSVEQADSDKDNLVMEGEKEEEAYQEINEAFGINPVRMVVLPRDTEFVSADVEEDVQVAELLYRCNDQNILYIVNMMYSKDSFGVDVEDKATDEYYLEVKGVDIRIREYQVEKTGTKKYSADFDYKKAKYFLIGTVEKADFELIVKNFYFSS